MQSQITQNQAYKALKSNVPVRNWCVSNQILDERYWTLERCIQEASCFPSRDRWEKESPVSYQKAIKRKWLTKCTTHIEGFRRKSGPASIWTLERCIEAGRACQKRSEFKRRFNYVYERARLKGWLDACCAHMR